MSQPLGFAELLAGGILVTAGITGHSLTDVLNGNAGNTLSWPWVTGTPTNVNTGPGGVATAKPGSTPPGGYGGGTEAPKAPWNPRGLHVASWIAGALNYAYAHGWRGTVTSGQRTPAEQIQAARNYGLNRYPNGPLASNHVGNGVYPNGAVDVTNPQGLSAALKGYIGQKLVWAGPVIGDTYHFSANGH